MFLQSVGFPSPPKADTPSAVRPPKGGGLLRGSTEQQRAHWFRF